MSDHSSHLKNLSDLNPKKLSFTNEEISMIIDGLKESMSPEEQQRIDMIRPLIM